MLLTPLSRRGILLSVDSFESSLGLMPLIMLVTEMDDACYARKQGSLISSVVVVIKP